MIKQTSIDGHNPLATESIGKLLIKFAVPCVIAMLVNSLYNIVDQIFIGQGVGYLGNAATNIAFPIVVIALAFSLLVGDGCGAYLSLKLGEGKVDDAAKGVGNAITLLAIIGIAIFVIGTLFMTPLLRIFGATDAILPYAQDYTRIILIGIPFVVVGTGVNSIIRADGSPKFAMVSMLIGAILNTILDPIAIFVLGWGVRGAAIATIIGQIVSFCMSIYYVKHFKNISFNKGLLKLKATVATTVMKFGLSSFITQMAITLVMIVMNNSLNYYGAMSPYGSEIPLSALGIVMKVNQIMISLLVGIAVGSQPILGFNYGAKNFERVKKTYLTAVSMASIISVIGFLLFQFYTQNIVSIFGQAEGLYNEFAIKCFKTFLMLCMTSGFTIVSSIYFQAIGHPMKAAILSLSRQVGFLIPMILILPRFFGVDGVLYAGPVADGLAFLLAGLFVFKEIHHLNASHELQQTTN
ncbi:MAG: MATE family efflux transporter [Cellulosilyticaceae bacterium]